jgi:hypothetical protein
MWQKHIGKRGTWYLVPGTWSPCVRGDERAFLRPLASPAFGEDLL